MAQYLPWVMEQLRNPTRWCFKRHEIGNRPTSSLEKFFLVSKVKINITGLVRIPVYYKLEIASPDMPLEQPLRDAPQLTYREVEHQEFYPEQYS